MTTLEKMMPIDILIIDDNRGDIRLVQEILKKGKMLINLQSAQDGIEAMDYLRNEGKYKTATRPDLILLDLNMPRKDGREVLEDIKSDENLKSIPVIIMTISKAEEDILRSYNLHANAYIVKPIELNQFMNTVRSIEDFWLTVVKLPPNFSKTDTMYQTE
jgi:chemotaxis family two-component system response regulator Rcp1